MGGSRSRGWIAGVRTDRPRVARDGPRSGVETGKDSRSRKTLLPIERGGIPPRAVRAGTRGLDGFRTKRRVSPPRRGAVLRSPSFTLNIFSLLVSPDPPAGASPRLDARTTAAKRARRRDEPRARVGLGRHPCLPDRGARATRPIALAVIVALAVVVIVIVVVVVVAAEHADPLSPVCLAPRAVRCSGAFVVGGGDLALSRQPPPARRIAVQKKKGKRRGEPIGIAEKRAPMTWQRFLAADFWQFFWFDNREKLPQSSDHHWSKISFLALKNLTSARIDGSMTNNPTRTVPKQARAVLSSSSDFVSSSDEPVRVRVTSTSNLPSHLHRRLLIF